MLEEFFCIHIDSNGNLARLPLVLDQYTPDMDRVPEFIVSLANDVSFYILLLNFIIIIIIYVIRSIHFCIIFLVMVSTINFCLMLGIPKVLI